MVNDCFFDHKGWELQKDAKSVTGTGQDWYYHWKAEELKRVNKSELVPTLIAVDPETQQPDETKVCIECPVECWTMGKDTNSLFFRLYTKVLSVLTLSTM